MGSGKSTIGAEIAKGLNRPFFDIDIEIEKNMGMSIFDIFNQMGEAGFRKIEAEYCKKAAALHNTIIATGGGCVELPENIKILQNSSVIIYLQADPETIFLRTAGSARPLLNSTDKMSKIQNLLARRKHLYEAAAHHTIDANKPIFDVLAGLHTYI